MSEDKKPEAPAKNEEEIEYTGGEYIDYDKLVNIVAGYQTRKFSEDVDLLENLNGLPYLYEQLQTSLTKGITSDQVEKRRKAFGSNEAKQKELKGCCKLFVEALDDLTLIILIIAAIISIIINMITEEEHRDIAWIEGAAILMAVGISAGVQAINDYEKEKQFKELNDVAMSAKKVTIIRDGKEVDVQIGQVVVGDIVTVIAGDEVAGDALLIHGSSVLSDESPMTGETIPLHKEPYEDCKKKRDILIAEGTKNTATAHDVPSPVLLSGTNIQNGSGKMLIIAVGHKSAIGKIKKVITGEGDNETPLQKKLEKIATDIGWFGLIAAIITFIIIIVTALVKMENGWGSTETGKLVDGFLIGITVLVVAIPEGLPLAVTLSLAFSVKKMLKEKNLVRQLNSCETMGSANVICSDKTGTLTKNEMYMTNFWNLESRVIYNPKTEVATNCTEFISDANMTLFNQSICCNSSADPVKKSGNPTELAMTGYLNAVGVNVMETRQKYKPINSEPFSSQRKRMSTLILDDDNKELMLIKGASELIVKGCTKLLDLKSGQITDIDQSVREDILSAITNFAKESLRTIGIAYKYTDGSYDKEKKDKNGVLNVESQDLILVGVCGIKDIIRPEVPHSVEQCHIAGIEVKMVTGDNKITAEAIAKECNILAKDAPETENSKWNVMLGKDFYEYVGGYKEIHKKDKNDKIISTKYEVVHPDKFRKIYEHVHVLARSRPEDKLTMVIGLMNEGCIVAVTGDGTNDAPALSRANVGFAMGVTGTEIAKQQADILLTDDNFTSIVSAVKWGRNIYDQIRKFLQFQLTVNVVAVLITFVSAAITSQSVLSATQMLWVNLIMDTLASLALATEPPTEALLKRKPIPANTSIVSKLMFKHIIGQSIFQFAVMIVVVFWGTDFLPEEISDIQRADWDAADPSSNLIRSGLENDGYDALEVGTPSRHLTYCFTIFVMMQVFNFINARKLYDEVNVFEGICNSWIFVVIVIQIFILQGIITTFGGIALGCCKWGLGLYGWLISIGIGILGVFWRFVIRCIPENKICGEYGNKGLTEAQKQRASSLSIRRSISKKNSKMAKSDYKN